MNIRKFKDLMYFNSSSGDLDLISRGRWEPRWSSRSSRISGGISIWWSKYVEYENSDLRADDSRVGGLVVLTAVRRS